MQILCPHCQNPIELTGLPPTSGDDICCPSCGSTFRLDLGTTTDHGGCERRTLGRFELLTVVGSGAYGTV